jgi:hypothetical protein
MKKVVVFLVFCTFGGLCFSQTAISLDAAMKNGISYFKGRLPGKTRISVLSIQGESAELSGHALWRFVSMLVNDGYFTVIERDAAALSELSREAAYQLSGEVSDETSLSVGKRLGAETVFLGTLQRSGAGYRLDIKAVSVESARIQGQWQAENIRPDPSWAAIAAAPRRAALVFTGSALSDEDKGTLGEALRRTLETQRLDLELDSEASTQGGGYVFTINFSSRQEPAAPPANTPLLTAEVYLTLRQGARTLRRSKDFRVTELTLPMLVRRCAEELGRDEAFFKGIAQSLGQ